MFLVEPRAGERCHYPSARALSAAIRRGELGPHARIFHQTTSRWLPISGPSSPGVPTRRARKACSPRFRLRHSHREWS